MIEITKKSTYINEGEYNLKNKFLYKGIKVYAVISALEAEKCIKEGKIVYGIRHLESNLTSPMTVEKSVYVNRWGFLICDTPIDFKGRKFLRIAPQDKKRFKESLNG